MFTLYTGPNCGYCAVAKQALNSAGLEYEEINAKDHREDLIARITSQGHPEPRTIPQVFHNGEYIPGGSDGLRAYLKTL